MNLLEILFLVASPFVGSFLGVVVTRLPQKQNIIQGRSRCDACGVKLAPRDLIPLVSWVLLKGRCRSCDAPISLFYPLIETTALVVVVWAAVLLEGPVFVMSCFLGWWLLCLAVIDAEHFILPDVLTLPLIPLGLGALYFINPDNVQAAVIGMIVGASFMLAVRGLYKALRGREGLGLGDVKLMAGAGTWVGWSGLAGVVLWASLAGLVFSLLKYGLTTPLQTKTELPLGTFLCLGIWLVWLYGPILFG